MSQLEIGPYEYRSVLFGPPIRGRARIVAGSQEIVQVYAVSPFDLNQFITGGVWNMHIGATVGPNAPMDVWTQLPYQQWHLLVLNQGNVASIVYYDAYY